MGRASQARGLLGYVGFRCPEVHRRHTNGGRHGTSATHNTMACDPQGSWSQISPETAEVEWCYAQTLDPYGVDPDLPEQCQQIGREYFARSPASDVWVNFRDLPKTIRDAL